jgi:hypothetical protein
MKIPLMMPAVAIAMAAGSAHADIIVNGSFELNPSGIAWSGPYGNYGGWIRLAPGTTYLTGWTVGGFGPGGPPGVDWHLGVSPYTPGAAKDGFRMIDLNIDGAGGQGPGQGTISQSFATNVGTRYRMSFWLSGPISGAHGGTLNPRSVNVDLTGIATTTFTAPASNPDNLIWYQQQLTFAATASLTTLMFSPLPNTHNAGYWGAFIDDVKVEVVPAPSSVAFIGLGVLLAVRRRTKTD